MEEDGLEQSDNCGLVSAMMLSLAGSQDSPSSTCTQPFWFLPSPTNGTPLRRKEILIRRGMGIDDGLARLASCTAPVAVPKTAKGTTMYDRIYPAVSALMMMLSTFRS